MEALTLFHQNFAVAESLLQVYRLFHGLNKADLTDKLRLAICAEWRAPDNSVVQHACNDRVSVLARAATRIPESLTLDGGLDFFLRQAVVVACTSVEAFFWDSLRANVLTVVQARRSGAHDSIRNLKLTVGDYISIQRYEDQDARLQQIILKNFERGTLYSAQSIEEVAKILTITRFWDEVETRSGVRARDLRKSIGELISRRNQIAHRADRPEDGEQPDGHGLRPINYAWTNQRVQTAGTLVNASAEVIGEAIQGLKNEIETAREQELARRLAEGSQ